MENENESAENEQAPTESVIPSTQILEHADDLKIRLNKFLTEKTLSDITLVAGLSGTKFPVHRLMLSASSEYFLTMFTGSFEESGEKEITLASVTGDILQQLISYCYSGSVTIHRENAQGLIEAATEYQFPRVVEACTDFLITQMDPDNCIGFINFAERYELKALHEKALHAFYNHFTRSTKAAEFKEMPFGKLKEILEKDDLNVTSEVEIVDAIKLWIADDTDRKSHLQELFEVIRLQHLDHQTVERLIEEYQSTVIEDSLRKALKSRAKRRKLMSNSPYRLMVVGGESSRPSIIEYYCPNMKKWRYWKKLPDLRNDYAATVWDNELCICGAEGGCTYYYYKLNVMTMERTSLPQSYSIKKASAVAVVEGTNPGIYILNGESKSVYRYISAGYNGQLNDTTIQQALPNVAVVGTFIYIYQKYETFSKMQKIDTSSENARWINTSLTNDCPSNIRIASLKNLIYYVSDQYYFGYYNTIDDTWTKLSNFPTSCHRLYNFNDTLYACTYRDVYTYDDINDVWTKMGSFNEDRQQPHLFSINVGNHPDFM